MITDDEARDIAAGYHSPSPHDSEITKVSHGVTPVDWPLFVLQVQWNRLTLGGLSETCREELDELSEWAGSKIVRVDRVDVYGSLHPTGDSWRVSVQFVDDPSVYSQVVTDCPTLELAQAHLPATVEASGYTLPDVARATFTRL